MDIWIVLNLIIYLIYIIVINDIIAASFDCPFLFASTSIINRDILNKIIYCAVHSSIMRLNESSMDKLMGLIETSVKMQMLSANGPRQVLLLTLNHLDSIRELASTNQLKQRIDLVQHNFYQVIINILTNSWLLNIVWKIK